MANGTIKKLKVSFDPNPEPVEQIALDALLTQLMVTVTRGGLRTDQLSEYDAIIRKEKEHGS